MKIKNKDQVEAIVELIQDWSDYEVEVTGYHDYDITPSLDRGMLIDLWIELEKIVSPKKWWQFWR